MTSFVIQIHIAESWIQKLADEKDFSFPVTEGYRLNHLKVSLREHQIFVTSEIMEKPGSMLEVSATPVWYVDQQQLQLEDVRLKAISKNILVKSAGWFASSFLQGKVDKKLEAAINQLFQSYRDRLIAQPFTVPIPRQGAMQVNANSLNIRWLELVSGAINLEIEINGDFQINLESTVENLQP